jgi:hypothetical protein
MEKLWTNCWQCEELRAAIDSKKQPLLPRHQGAGSMWIWAELEQYIETSPTDWMVRWFWVAIDPSRVAQPPLTSSNRRCSLARWTRTGDPGPNHPKWSNNQCVIDMITEGCGSEMVRPRKPWVGPGRTGWQPSAAYAAWGPDRKWLETVVGQFSNSGETRIWNGLKILKLYL